MSTDWLAQYAHDLFCDAMQDSSSINEPGLGENIADEGFRDLSSDVSLGIITVGELFGGVERHVLGMLMGLQQLNIVPTLFLFHDGELAEQARALKIQPILLPCSNTQSIAAARRLADVISDHDIQVIHAHGYKATVISGIARLMRPFFLVKTEHGLSEPMQGRPISSLRENLYRKLDAWVVRKSFSAICYVTADLRDHYRSIHRGIPNNVIQNGIEDYDGANMSVPQDLCGQCFNLILVGRIDTVKGHEYAIRALAINSVPKNVQLYVIGVGPQEGDLKLLAHQLNLQERVHFLGFRRNILDYIANADVLVMPSIHEGLPYTLIEAMALCTPVIASRVGGLKEILEDSITALLVPVGDISALAEAITRLYHDPEFRTQLSNNAQQVQRSSFSLHAMVRKYMSVYQGVLLTDNPRKGRP